MVRQLTETDKKIILECLHIVSRCQPLNHHGADKKSGILRIIRNLESKPQYDDPEVTRFI